MISNPINPMATHPMDCHVNRMLKGIGFALLFLLIATSSASAQKPSLPSQNYLLIKALLDDGDYKQALKNFRRAGRGAFKGVGGLWLDSICHYAMVGEVHYKLGNFNEALSAYNNSLKLYLRYRTWMLSVSWPSDLRPATGVAKFLKRCDWGKSKRRILYLKLPSKILVQKGKVNNQQEAQQGGVINPAILRKVLVIEVQRCAALAQRRRREILGPLSKHHPLTETFRKGFSGIHTIRGHWTVTYNLLQSGLSLAAEGNHASAVIALRRSILIAGKYDHDLTCVSLLELGKLALEAKQLDQAADYFLEATYSAFKFEDQQVLEEAFYYGNMVHLIANKKGVYKPLRAAQAWAKKKRYEELYTSLSIMLAENYNVTGNQAGAKTALGMARKFVTRDMKNSAIAARFYWQSAIYQFKTKQPKLRKTAIADLNTALSYLRHGSLRLYHISMVDLRWAKKIKENWNFSPRIAVLLYEQVLRDPTNYDWVSSPMETLAVLTTPHSIAYEHWFEATLQRKEPEKAILIAEKTLRHRFFSTLPLGGRLLSLRWLLEGPSDVLDKSAQAQRQTILRRYTEYAKISANANKLRTEIKKIPLLPEDRVVQKKQAAGLAALAKASDYQELILKEIALQREPSSFSFPPVKSISEIQKNLGDDHALWFFFATKNNLHSFMFNSEKYTHWSVKKPRAIRQKVGEILREMGNTDGNSNIAMARIRTSSWRKPANQLVDILLQGSSVALDKFPSKVTIVPAGPLWYLPFETLPLTKDADSELLISKCRVRYAPTASLSVPQIKPIKNGTQIAVKVGRLHQGDEDEAASDAFQEIKQSIPSATAIDKKLPANSPLIASLLDGLIVLDEIDTNTKGLYSWRPLSADKIPHQGALSGWFNLPWGGPNFIILPGFHTHAEHAFRKKGNKATGEEVFLTACGLMSTGSKTILLSRWRTGGKTCYDLIREFTQELPHTTAAKAWQRSVLLARMAILDPELEPRIGKPKKQEMPKTSHPFFWAGYMLID